MLILDWTRRARRTAFAAAVAMGSSYSAVAGMWSQVASEIQLTWISSGVSFRGDTSVRNPAGLALVTPDARKGGG